MTELPLITEAEEMDDDAAKVPSAANEDLKKEILVCPQFNGYATRSTSSSSGKSSCSANSVQNTLQSKGKRVRRGSTPRGRPSKAARVELKTGASAESSVLKPRAVVDGSKKTVEKDVVGGGDSKKSATESGDSVQNCASGGDSGAIKTASRKIEVKKSINYECKLTNDDGTPFVYVIKGEPAIILPRKMIVLSPSSTLGNILLDDVSIKHLQDLEEKIRSILESQQAQEKNKTKKR